MHDIRVLAFVFTGGDGARLQPLADKHSKPAFKFAGGYRILDLALSNLINSGISPIHVLTQSKPRSLIEHMHAAWGAGANEVGRQINVILPKSELGTQGFRGTADAVYQNLDLLDQYRPDLVAVFAADQVYGMDVWKMIESHREKNAELSIAAVSVPLDQASLCGVMVTDPNGRVRRFQENPQHPEAISGNPGLDHVAMGNYLFEPALLVRALNKAHARGEHDFGHHVIPNLSSSTRTYAYDFETNLIPEDRSSKRGYWRDIGTLRAHQQDQSDVSGLVVRHRVSNPLWPFEGSAPESSQSMRPNARNSERDLPAFRSRQPANSA